MLIRAWKCRARFVFPPRLQADVAFTIASYINAIVRREGIRSTLASINHVLSDHETNMVGSGTNGKSLGSRLDGRLDSDA